MRTRIAGVMALGVVLVTACGSTVHLPVAGSRQAVLTDDGLGTVVTADPSSGAPVAGAPTTTEAVRAPVAAPVGGPVTTSTAPTVAGTRSSAAARSATSAAATTAARSSAAASAVPRSTAPVTVGYLVIADTGAAFSALGYDGLSSGDGPRQATTAAALVSGQGGIAGRKITPITYALQATGDIATQSQAACSTFFDDNKVQAVISANGNDVVEGCAAQHGVPYVQVAPQTLSDADAAAHPNVVLPGTMTYERAATNLVQGLVRQGWFKPASPTEKVTIGLITQDGAAWAGVKPIVEQQLKAAGLSLADTYLMPTSDAGPSQGATAGQSAGLRFRSEGINRVVAVDGGGFGVSWFGVDTNTQGYHPRLGITSLALPQSETAVLSAATLAGAAGIGWSPVVDTVPAQQPAATARATGCDQAMKAAGETVSGLAQQEQRAICEGTWVLADAWKAGTVTLAGFQQGLTALGKTHPSILTFSADLTDRRGAASSYRDITFDGGCTCWRYGAQTYPAS